MTRSNCLPVWFRDTEIGTIVVEQRDRLRILGRFEPTPAFAENRGVFEELYQLEKRVDASIDGNSEDYYQVHALYIEKLQNLTKAIRIELLEEGITEFNLSRDGCVEIHLGGDEIDHS